MSSLAVFQAFLQDSSLKGDATAEEIEFLREPEIRAKTADPPLLLPGTAEPARPAPFSPRVDRGEDGVDPHAVQSRIGPHRILTKRRQDVGLF